MKLNLNEQLVTHYKSASQKARILTEQWVDNSIFCPNCGRLNIDKYPNNQPVADFYCSNCKEEYELKSKQNTIGTKIVDGAYRTMLERLTSSNNPNFFLLNYDLSNLEVINFLVIPKHFFVPEIIEKRKPLSPTAQRAGWVGCNILLQSIPQTGKIFFIKNKRIEPKEKVLAEWQKTLFCERRKKFLLRVGYLIQCEASKNLESVNLCLKIFMPLKKNWANFTRTTSTLKIKSASNYNFYAIRAILISYRVDIIGLYKRI